MFIVQNFYAHDGFVAFEITANDLESAIKLAKELEHDTSTEGECIRVISSNGEHLWGDELVS